VLEGLEGSSPVSIASSGLRTFLEIDDPALFLLEMHTITLVYNYLI
jgi:hypothetical protein